MEKKLTSTKKVILIPASLVLYLIRVYQRCISPVTAPRCRYYPSCSEYFAESVRCRGFLSGSISGLYRIIRCNPFARGGYDPVNKRRK